MNKSGVTELGASMDIVADTENVMKGMQPKSTFSVDPASMKSEPSHFIMVKAVQNPNTVNNSFARTKEREAHHPRNSSAITGEYTHIETEMDGKIYLQPPSNRYRNVHEVRLPQPDPSRTRFNPVLLM